MSFSINKLLTVILVVMVVGIVFLFLAKINLAKYVGFLPDFGDADKDRIIDDRVRDIGEEGKERVIGEENGGSEDKEEGVFFLESDESCCCLYENNKNTEECQITKLEEGQYCSNKLEGDWKNVNDKYCKEFSESVSVEPVVKKPWWKFW